MYCYSHPRLAVRKTDIHNPNRHGTKRVSLQSFQKRVTIKNHG